MLTLDPPAITFQSEADMASTVFEPLLRVTDGARIVPWLASRWEAEEGGRKHRLWLREDVRFHDGCRMTARDALIERARVGEPAARHAIYREIEEHLQRHALILPLYHEQSYCFARPEVRGLKLTIMTPTVLYEELSLAP